MRFFVLIIVIMFVSLWNCFILVFFYGGLEWKKTIWNMRVFLWMLLNFLFYFVLRFVCLLFVWEFGGWNILACWKWKDVYYYFCMVLFSNQELKENKTLYLKGETFHMLCHFTRLNWNKQLCFSKIITIDCFVFVSFVCVMCFSNIKNVVWILEFLFVYIIWKVREWGKGNCLM